MQASNKKINGILKTFFFCFAWYWLVPFTGTCATHVVVLNFTGVGGTPRRMKKGEDGTGQPVTKRESNPRRRELQTSALASRPWRLTTKKVGASHEGQLRTSTGTRK